MKIFNKHSTYGWYIIIQKRKKIIYFYEIIVFLGTPGDLFSAQYVATQWKLQGLDDVQMIDYDMLMSYPDNELANK